MSSWLGRTLSFFIRNAQLKRDDAEANNGLDDDDPLLLSGDLEKHSLGELSWAAVQANAVMEDQSHIEISQNATFVGVYDGHGGPDASIYIKDHLFKHLPELTQDNGELSEDAIRKAFAETENGFLELVKNGYSTRPAIAAVGSCCLVGVILGDALHIANLGDSRAILGYMGNGDDIVAEQLTEDHNACMEDVREELKAMHPNDPHIVVLNRGVWRVKGQIQVSRSIGDAYLKNPMFALDSSFPRFHLPEPPREPVLSSDPAITSRKLQANDKFLIFASDGLWEHLSNQEAVELVHNNPRKAIARRLVKVAMEKAAEARNASYDEIKSLDAGYRRLVHDDISVIVVFLSHHDRNGNAAQEPWLPGDDPAPGPSNSAFR